MALFDQYTQPGVYVTSTVEDAGINLFGDTRVTVLIGEGEELKYTNNYELHRGSSASVDDRKVNENLSDQINGQTRVYQVSYYPIVNGDGTGTTSVNPKDIQVVVDGNPVNVSAIDGANGRFTIDNVLTVGSDISVSYYFKRKDTLITDEDLSFQIPSFATLSTQSGNLVLTLQNPGFAGNNVSLTFTSTPSAPLSDALAVTGQGTDTISIEIQKGTVGSPVARTIQDIINLINAGIPTLSGGNIVVSSSANLSTSAAAHALAHFTGGSGQATNKIFKVENVPVVDGTNGGVVTNLPQYITVSVNGNPVTVTALDGVNGLITLANGVSVGSKLTVTYYTNTYQDTFDFLPSDNVNELIQVGYAPDRSDFIDGVDYVLDGNTINWGSSASIKVGQQTSGFTAFDATYITTTLVDSKTYLEQAIGTVNGINNVFTLMDTPVDGSGLSRPTDNPALVQVFVGTTPVTALAAGPVSVIRLSAVNKQVTLANPPASGNVYVTYYKNKLADNVFTLTVKTPGVTGQGKYSVQDKNSKVIPTVSLGNATVADPVFTSSGGIVWPNSLSDLSSVAGAPDETVTLTFQNTGEQLVVSAGTQASSTTVQPGITFRATTVGTGGNLVTIAFTSGVPTADASAITTTGDAISVAIEKGDTTTRTLADIVALFATYPPTTTDGGVITATLTGTGTNLATTAPATNLAGGTNPVIKQYSTKFVVSSSLLTGGSAGTGYLGETYQDAVTGLSFTIVDPNNALDYGYTTPPTSYYYAAGDTLVFSVSKSVNWTTSSIPTLAIPGLHTKVVSTLGMNVNDTAIVNTYNKAGNEPKVGEFYYVSFSENKVASDYALKVYTNLSDVYAAYGQPTVSNRLSLAAKLAVQNGATTIACLQVQKLSGLSYASDQSFMDAITSLNSPIPGSQNKASIIVPLSTSSTVQQYLSKFLTVQSAPRNKGEAIGFIGYAIGTTPATARQIARSIKSERVIAVYPAGAILSIDIDNTTSEFAVGGEFLAAAMAGMSTDPSIDVATTLTRRSMVGFNRLVARFDDPTMDQMAADGVTLLIENNGAFTVRHYLTTNPSNPITKEPTNTTITDYVRKGIRSALDPFIGRKNLGALVNDVTVVMNSLMKSYVKQEIIEGYKNLDVQRDINDPTVLNVTVAFKPVFSLLYVNVTLKVTTKL